MLSSDPEAPEPTDSTAATFFHNLPAADRPGDIHRRIWTEWIGRFFVYGSRCTGYEHDKCWGSTILRTSYEDDDKFALAIAAVRRLALMPIQLDFEARGSGPARDQPANVNGPKVNGEAILNVGAVHPKARETLQQAYRGMVRRARKAAPLGTRCTHDWVITHELICRYHNLIVEDRPVLDGADVAAAWQYYHHSGCEERESGLRSAMFVLMDQEAVNHLAAVPSEQELASMTSLERARVSWQHWIKVVTTRCKCTDEGDGLDEISDDHMDRRRIRMFDFFDIFLWLQHRDISEMGVEGHDCQRFPGYRDSEWYFCENPDGQPVAWPWLEGLYGENIPRWKR
ncbi:hypothetical protein ACHAQH_009927 [Verticillium albo-atrum]